jgi:hypothetical protein
VREHDREKVERHRDSEPVKISAAQSFSVLEDERIVGGCIQLPRDGFVDKVEGVENRPMHLRHAA